MNRRQRRAQRPATPSPRTLSEAWKVCPYRTFLALEAGTPDELMTRFGAAFAAVGGEVTAIEPSALDDFVSRILAGQTVIVFGDRRDLRDAAKSQIMAAVQTAQVGAAGSA